MPAASDIASIAQGCCQKPLSCVANLPYTLAAKTEALTKSLGGKNGFCCSSRQAFLTITANLCDNAAFFGDPRPHGEVGMVSYGPFVKACGALREATIYARFCLFEAKRKTLLAKGANNPQSQSRSGYKPILKTYNRPLSATRSVIAILALRRAL
jgi:hypothetical protein